MPGSSLTFLALINQFNALYQEGSYAKALHLIETEGNQFPENIAQLMAWRSAMLARLGQVDEAVQVLQSADAQGCWYHEEALRHDPDFAAMQDYPGFASLLERMAARRQAAASQMVPSRQVIEPAGPGPHPLCLALHSNHANPSIILPDWQPVVNLGWTLAAPRSTQPGWASDISVWDDIPRSLAEMKTQIAEIIAEYTVNPSSVISGGFAGGAVVSLHMALDPDFHLRGIIAHDTWADDAILAELAQAASSAPPARARVVLIAAEGNVEFLNMARKVNDLLTAHGVCCRLLIASGAMHGFPPEFPQLLQQAVDWIMETAEL